MKTSREKQLEATLQEYREALRKEKQRNRELNESREKHKQKGKDLALIVKQQRLALKKND